MICPECRQLVADGTPKCPRCGAELPESRQPQAVPNAPAPLPYGTAPADLYGGSVSQPAPSSAMPGSQQAGGYRPQQPGGQYPGGSASTAYQSTETAPQQPYMPANGQYPTQQPYPSYFPPMKAPGEGKASTAMGLGIASLVCTFLFPLAAPFLGIAAVVTGSLARKENPYVTKATPGLIMGIAGTVISIVEIVLVILVLAGMFSLSSSYDDWSYNSNAYNYNYNYDYNYNSDYGNTYNSNLHGNANAHALPNEPEGFVGKWYLHSGKMKGEEISQEELENYSFLGLDCDLELSGDPSTAVLNLGYESFRGVWSQTGMEHGTLELSGGNKYEMSLQEDGKKLFVSGGDDELSFESKPMDMKGNQPPVGMSGEQVEASANFSADAHPGGLRDGTATFDDASVYNEPILLADQDSYKLELVGYGTYISSPAYAIKVTNKSDRELEAWAQHDWKLDGGKESTLGIMEPLSPGESGLLPVCFYQRREPVSGSTKVDGTVSMIFSDTFETVGTVHITGV